MVGSALGSEGFLGDVWFWDAVPGGEGSGCWGRFWREGVKPTQSRRTQDEPQPEP